MDATTLAEQLGVTAMAVRQHLYALLQEQLVDYEEETPSVGRPAKLWRLTCNADHLFPAGYAELTLSLMESIKEAFGEAGLDQLLDIRSRQQIADYSSKLDRQQDWSDRLQGLADLRTQEGYMAEVQPQQDGSVLLIENHCPICAAATACPGLCARELQVFRHILGDDVAVERTEHIVAGARRCAYRVAATDPSPVAP